MTPLERDLWDKCVCYIEERQGESETDGNMEDDILIHKYLEYRGERHTFKVL